jgi:electron transport complex protein RnfD
MSKLITVAPSPHIHSGQKVSKLMYGVVFAMLPALAVSIYFFGMGAIYVTLLSVVSCLLFEFLIQKYIMKTPPTISDGSAMVTGILLAFNLPSSLPPHIIIIGALVSIGIGKLSFGGLGNNPFNPALVGRVFLLLSFPTRLTKYATANGFKTPVIISQENLDAYTGETPLALIKNMKVGETVPSVMESNGIGYGDFFWGEIGGSLGEIAGFALLLGLIYMLWKKIITWHTPVSIVGSMFALAGILWIFSLEGNAAIMDSLGWNIPYIEYFDKTMQMSVPFHMADPLYHILTGGALLGAFYMATDYVTSPMNGKAQIIYGIGIGIITNRNQGFRRLSRGYFFCNTYHEWIYSFTKPLC